MPCRIEDYALIGDCETAALVSNTGSIDWLCWPRFDSGACFAALLGSEENGHWQITPSDEPKRVIRRYRGNTLILETRFETDGGAVLLIDFMPPRGNELDIVRIVVGETGTVSMKMELIVRFGYGRDVPWVSRIDHEMIHAICGPDMVVLSTPTRVEGHDLKSTAEFTVSAGQRIPFVLTFGASHLPPPTPVDPEEALQDTESFWTEWAAGAVEAGEWNDAVMRSLVTLKALTYAPTGGMVAAPTTSLPEMIGGVRNWDYRFCWLRDATLTLLSFMNAGFVEEAGAWRDWLVRAIAGAPQQMQILYGIAGERRVPEWEVDWLSGYEGSRPVRVGNDAHEQLQLDVYGEVMDALYQARHRGLPPNESVWALQRALLHNLEKIWMEPDEGIWEFRGPRRHFTYSKVMTWVAFDRAVRSVEEFGLDGPVDHWRALRDRICDDICRNGFNKKIGSFVQSYGSSQLDASLLLLPTVGFLPVTDERIRGTVEAIEKRLVVNGLVLRYDTARTSDGLPPGEGAFLACSFWLADVYLLMGRVEEARELCERLLSLRNDVGLMAEEYDLSSGRQIGNFPQAFSHVSIVNTVHNLARSKKPVEQRSEERAERLS